MTAEIEKETNEIVHKIGNPGKILFSSEEELLVCLGITEPDVTATLHDENSTQHGTVDSS